MSNFFFEGPNRPYPAKDLHSSPTGYRERVRGGPDGERTVRAVVTWPVGTAQRYFGRVPVTLSDGTLKNYHVNALFNDPVSSRNGVQTRVMQLEPGQGVLVSYRPGIANTETVIVGSTPMQGEWAPFLEEGKLIGIDEPTPLRNRLPMPTTILPTVVNFDWLGTWEIPPMRGLRTTDPLNGNDAGAGHIPGALVQAVDRFSNVANIRYGEAESNHYGDDDVSQGYMDGIGPRAIRNAQQAIRQALTNYQHTLNTRSIHASYRFLRSTLPLLNDRHGFVRQDKKAALRLIETASQQLQEAIDVAQTHLRWLQRYPLWYIRRFHEHWGRLGGTGLNPVADHIPPPLQYLARSVFGGYLIPPPFHQAIANSVNFATGPGPDLSINRWELYKTASPLPIVNLGRLVGGGGGGSAGSAAAQSVPRPVLHISPEDNNLDYVNRPADALAAYLAIMGVENARELADGARGYLVDQSLWDLARSLASVASNRDRLVLAVAARELHQPAEATFNWLTKVLGRALPEVWAQVILDDQPRSALFRQTRIEIPSSTVWLSGTPGVAEWCRQVGLDPVVLSLVEGDPLGFFSELCSRAVGRSYKTMPDEERRLAGLVARAFSLPPLGDLLVV